MYLVIAEDQEWFKSKYHFWDNVYGTLPFSFSFSFSSFLFLSSSSI